MARAAIKGPALQDVGVGQQGMSLAMQYARGRLMVRTRTICGHDKRRAIEKGILSDEALWTTVAHTPETTSSRDQPLSPTIGGQHRNAG